MTQLRIAPGASFRERRGILYTFGWSGTEPTIFLKLGGRFAPSGRSYGITLSNAWRWRTRSESMNGESVEATMHAAAFVLHALGADISDPNQTSRQCIALIDTIQHAIPELLKLPDLDMIDPRTLGYSTTDDPLFTVTAHIAGQKVAERGFTAAELDLTEGANV